MGQVRRTFTLGMTWGWKRRHTCWICKDIKLNIAGAVHADLTKRKQNTVGSWIQTTWGKQWGEKSSGRICKRNRTLPRHTANPHSFEPYGYWCYTRFNKMLNVQCSVEEGKQLVPAEMQKEGQHRRDRDGQQSVTNLQRTRTEYSSHRAG